MPLTEVFNSSGHRRGKQLLLTALGLMEKKTATSVTYLLPELLWAPTQVRDLITTWGSVCAQYRELKIRVCGGEEAEGISGLAS